VLAARRTRPSSAAGRWEFPGGKVEAGESPSDALVREVAEELGVTIAVTGWLAGEAPIGSTHVLTVALVSLLSGDPDPTEHDEIRWLAAHELGDVDWLEPDRPFLPELKGALEA
jgi:8-oxo-dGTP diphosphatase